MSFNVNTRLNNLQAQINTISNRGLTNPLIGPFDAAGYTLNNIHIINGGTNAIELKTNNIGGIILDNPLFSTSDITTTGNISVNTLKYTLLDPPINYNAVSFHLGTRVSEPTEGNILMLNNEPASTFISNQSVSSPVLSCTIVLGTTGPDAGSNSISLGFSSKLSEITPSYGVYMYPTEGRLTFFPANIGFAYTSSTLDIEMSIVGTNMKVYINGTQQPTLSQTVPNVPYYLNCSAYVGLTSQINVNNINYSINTLQNLSEVLQTGNDGGNQSITGVNALTVRQLNYTTLNPPISASTQNLTQTLTIGNSAGNLSITNLNDIASTTAHISGTLTCNTLAYNTLLPPIQNPTLSQVLTSGNGAGNQSINSLNDIASTSAHITGQLNSGSIVNSGPITTNQLFTNTAIYPYGTSGSNYQMWATGDTLLIQQYKGTPTPVLTNQPIIITDSSSIVFNTGKLLLANSQLLDCKYYTPSLKCPISNTPFTVECNDERLSHILEVDFPTTSSYIPNYGEVLFTNINITFNSIGPSGPDPFPSNLNAMIYLTNTPLGAYNPAISNNIVIPMTANKTQTIFISTIPIILYYYASSAIATLFCVIKFNGVNPSSDPIYSIVYTLNGIMSGSVCNKNALSITYGQ